MLRKLLGKKDKADKEESIDPELSQKIFKMDLGSMRLYMKSEEAQIDGLYLIMQKLTQPINDKGEYYLKADDMDTKKKKAFELVLLIAKSKKISAKTLEGIEKFIQIHKEIIKEYDYEHKEIYTDRLHKSLQTAVVNLETLSKIHQRLDL
ncbi:MAG: hypothetical protein FAF05_01385 [Epsilonproteobacteria bacterium]|nr:hypothetical protein [Campylobacterota bacterium]